MKRIFTLFFVLFAVSVFAQEKIYAPTLTSPANAAVNQIVNVTLDWGPVAGAVKYQVHLDTSASFTNPQVVIAPYSAWQSALLLFGETYNWRVRAIDAADDTSAWSATWTFTVVSKPTLDTPSDSASKEPVITALKWLTMSGVASYQAQFDSVNTFNSGFLKEDEMTTTNWSTTNNWYGDMYYWRVRGINGTDTSDWSLIRCLTTKDSIGLKFPADGATNVHPTDTLKIYSIYGTTGYQFAFDTDPAFSAPLYFDWDSSALVIIPGDTSAKGPMDTIPFGTFYYKVRLYNNVDTSKWSNVRSLSTVDKVTLSAPADDATNVVVTTNFSWTEIRGTKYYVLEYDTSAAFTAPTKVNVTGLSYDPPTNLLSQTDYYWRVRAVTERDTTPVWDEYHFKTYFGVGIDENSAVSYSVYPNPTSGIFNVTIESASSARLEILNVLGDVVLSQDNLVNGVNTISMSSLNNGVYMLRLYIDGNMSTSRIIKK